MSEKRISNPARTAGQKWQQLTVRALTMILAGVVMFCLAGAPAGAQEQPSYSPDQLEHLVSKIALYPDPLLAQALAAATYPDQIPEAARWSDEHHYLTGNELASAIESDQLAWDPSVQALLPFPSVLDAMASDMNWTADLGNAFLVQQEDVMAAVQRLRLQARDYGYLRTGPQVVVGGGPYITILPARADYVVVPYYDPLIVFARPRPGFFVGEGISFRFGVPLGIAFRPWGWGYNRIAWDQRVVFINNAPWRRTWVNRREYVHPYTVRRYEAPRPPERHELMERSERERSASRYGHERVEEHRETRARNDDRGRDDHGKDDRGHDNRRR